MKKKEIEDTKILQAIFKNAYKKNHACLVCDDHAINSHLLQKNGILNIISKNNHLIQIKGKDFFSKEDGNIQIQLIGLNNAMSYPLFCNKHDTEIFSSIEKEKLDLNSYSNNLLFSYRSLCAEIWKKSVNIDIYNRILNARQFSDNKPFLEMSSELIYANTCALKDLNWFKDQFELEFNQVEDEKKFIFKKIDFDFIPISVSAIYSPIIPEIHTLEVLKNGETILDHIFINLIPQKGATTLILGYHKGKVNDWIYEYIESWLNLNNDNLGQKLTDLLATKVETWAISPEKYNELNPKKVELFKKYWDENSTNLRIDQNIDFNLFD